MMQKIISFVLIAIASAMLGCSASSPETVSLPVPFAGSLTADTNIAIAEGNALVPSVASLKTQTADEGISWELHDATSGASRGTVTFFPNTMTEPELTSFTAGTTTGVRRHYFMKVQANLGTDTEVVSSNAEFFEYPTDYNPSFSTTTGEPVVRLALFSGKIDGGQGNITMGQIISGKFLMGMAEAPDNLFQFQTQIESSLLVHGLPAFVGTGNPDGKVVMTLLTQGASSIVNLPNDTQPLEIALPLLVPGQEDPIGIDFKTFTASDTSNPDFLQLTADITFFDGVDHITTPQIRMVLHHVPEVTSTFADTIENVTCPNDPGCNAEFLDQILAGEAFISTIEGVDTPFPVDCNSLDGIPGPTGRFASLCEQFGGLNVHFRCAIMFNGTTFAVYPLEGAWIFTRP